MRTLKVVMNSFLVASISTAAMAQQPQVPVQQQPGQAIPQQQGQNANAQANQAGATRTNQQGQRQSSDKAIATCLALGNHEEIALAKLAQEKADSKEVKEFAKMMIEEHQSFLDKLKSIAPEAAQPGFLTQYQSGNRGHGDGQSNAVPGATSQGNSSQDNREKARSDANPSNTANASNSNSVNQTNAAGQAGANQRNTSVNSEHGLDLVEVQHELASQCLKDTKEMLSEKSGSDFDKAYIGLQIVKHGEMLSKLTVFKKHVDGELESVIGSASETVRKHLKEAKHVMGELDKSSSKSSE